MSDASPVPAERTTPAPPVYRERLWPSFWVWLVIVAGIGSFAIVGSKFGPGQALLGAVASAVVLVGLTLRGLGTVEIDGGEFRAGRAHLPLSFVGGAQALDGAAMTAQRGPGLDARAFLCLRGWIRGGVRVDLTDPRDPTPYWLVSSRRPHALAAALDVAARPEPDGSN